MFAFQQIRKRLEVSGAMAETASVVAKWSKAEDLCVCFSRRAITVPLRKGEGSKPREAPSCISVLEIMDGMDGSVFGPVFDPCFCISAYVDGGY
jgi:hypothetical protein